MQHLRFQVGGDPQLPIRTERRVESIVKCRHLPDVSQRDESCEQVSGKCRTIAPHQCNQGTHTILPLAINGVNACTNVRGTIRSSGVRSISSRTPRRASTLLANPKQSFHGLILHSRLDHSGRAVVTTGTSGGAGGCPLTRLDGAAATGALHHSREIRFAPNNVTFFSARDEFVPSILVDIKRYKLDDPAEHRIPSCPTALGIEAIDHVRITHLHQDFRSGWIGVDIRNVYLDDTLFGSSPAEAHRSLHRRIQAGSFLRRRWPRLHRQRCDWHQSRLPGCLSRSYVRTFGHHGTPAPRLFRPTGQSATARSVQLGAQPQADHAGQDQRD